MSGPDRPIVGEPFAAVLDRFLTRRALLRRVVVGFAAASAWPLDFRRARAAGRTEPAPANPPPLERLRHSTEDRLRLPRGYYYSVPGRWGDPVLLGAPPFGPAGQTGESQQRQFGYNPAFAAVMPLPAGSKTSPTGVMVVSLEGVNPELMFPTWDGKLESKTREMVDVELAAVGVALVVVKRDPSGMWGSVKSPSFNRRLTAESPCVIAGPAAGHPWLRTAADTTGTRSQGVLAASGGGITPWNTVLLGEGDFGVCFGGSAPAESAVASMQQRYRVRNERGWARHEARFDVAREPHEPMRFGWIVEIDPYDPESTPVKRTALGRLHHEGATTTLGRGGQVVVYTGDRDPRGHLYKFVSAARHDASSRNASLLDAGTLHAARFKDDGSGEWVPLAHGAPPLTAGQGFASQAEILVDARRAGTLVGATSMDLPGDVAVSPRTGKLYFALSGNPARTAAQVDPANPRAGNPHGHILEIVEDAGDPAATTFRWDLLLAAGDPSSPDHRARYQGHRDVDWLSRPRSLTVDDDGRLWVATDGQPSSIGHNDALYVVETEGPRRGVPVMLLSAPRGAALRCPSVVSSERTCFVSVQHPGEGAGSSATNPLSKFPDYRPGMPPRPSVLAIFRQDGRKVGY